MELADNGVGPIVPDLEDPVQLQLCAAYLQGTGHTSGWAGSERRCSPSLQTDLVEQTQLCD